MFRNTEISGAMRGTQTQINGSVRGIASPERGAHDSKRGTHLNDNNNNKSAGSSDNALDGKKGGGSSSGSGDATPAVWPPKFVIALTNKEKEEDFMAIKGSKLPQRPKKRAKLIQRTLNVSSTFLKFLLFVLRFNLLYLAIYLVLEVFLYAILKLENLIVIDKNEIKLEVLSSSRDLSLEMVNWSSTTRVQFGT